MPDGYRVTLGNGSLDGGDVIGGPLVTFTTASTIGTGSWTWSGTWNGQTFVNTFEPGVYYLGSDGFVYFVPDSDRSPRSPAPPSHRPPATPTLTGSSPGPMVPS